MNGKIIVCSRLKYPSPRRAQTKNLSIENNIYVYSYTGFRRFLKRHKPRRTDLLYKEGPLNAHKNSEENRFDNNKNISGFAVYF